MLNRSTLVALCITVGYIRSGRSGRSRMLKLCTNVSAHCIYTLLPAGAIYLAGF